MGYEWNEKMIEYGLTPSRRVAGNPSIISWASTYWKHHQQLFVAGDLQQAMYLWVPSSTSGYSSVNCSLIWIVGNMMINTGMLRRSFSDCYPDQGNLSNYKWGFHQEVNGNSSLVIHTYGFYPRSLVCPKMGMNPCWQKYGLSIPPLAGGCSQVNGLYEDTKVKAHGTPIFRRLPLWIFKHRTLS